MPTYLTVDEAALLLRVKTQTIYKWICERKIPSIAIGGRTLFDQGELLTWVNSGRRMTITEAIQKQAGR